MYLRKTDGRNQNYLLRAFALVIGKEAVYRPLTILYLLLRGPPLGMCEPCIPPLSLLPLEAFQKCGNGGWA